MQTKLANLLRAHAPLMTLVGRRVVWDTLPQGSPQPSIVMFVVSGVTDYTMAGASGLVMTRVQFDCRGESAAEARAVADALSERLSGLSTVFEGFHFQGCFAQGRRTRFEKAEAETWFTDSPDFTIHWAPA